jgi:hypothetical protein
MPFSTRRGRDKSVTNAPYRVRSNISLRKTLYPVSISVRLMSVNMFETSVRNLLPTLCQK